MKANQQQIIYSVIEGITKYIVQALPDMISLQLKHFGNGYVYISVIPIRKKIS